MCAIASLLESHGLCVHAMASADGAEWLNVSGVTKSDLERVLPSGAVSVPSAVDGVVLVALAVCQLVGVCAN